MLRKKLVSLFVFSSFFSVNFINQTAHAGLLDGLNPIPRIGQAKKAIDISQAQPVSKSENPYQYGDENGWNVVSGAVDLNKVGSYGENTPMYVIPGTVPGSRGVIIVNPYYRENIPRNVRPQALPERPVWETTPGSREGFLRRATQKQEQNQSPPADSNDRPTNRELLLGPEASNNSGSIQNVASGKSKDIPGDLSQLKKDATEASDKYIKHLKGEDDSPLPQKIDKTATANNSTGNRADEFSDSPVSKVAEKAAVDITNNPENRKNWTEETINKLQASDIDTRELVGGLPGNTNRSTPQRSEGSGNEVLSGIDYNEVERRNKIALNKTEKPDGVKRNSDGTVKYDTADKSGQKNGYDTPDEIRRNSDGTVKYDTANKPGSDSGGSGKGRVVDGDWFPGSLNGSKGGASSASGGIARASKSAVGSSGGAAGSLGGGSFGSIGEVAEALSNPNLSVDDAAKFGLSQYNLIDPNPSKMTFRNLEMAKYMPGLIQGAMSGNLKGAVGGAVGGMAGGLIGDSLGSGVVSQLAQGAASGGVSSAISGGNPLGGAMNGVKGAGLGIAKDTVLGAMNNVIPSPNIGTGLRNVVDSTNCFTTGGCIKSPREFATNMGHNTLNSLSNGGNATSDQAISDAKTIQDAKALSNAKNVNRPVYLPNSQREKDLQAALARTGQEYPTVRDDYARRSPNINQPSQPSGFTGTTQNPAIDRIPRAGTNQPSAQQNIPETMQRVREQNRIQNPFGNQTNSTPPKQSSVPETMQRVREQNRIQNPFGNQTNSTPPKQSSVPETMQRVRENLRPSQGDGSSRPTEFTGHETTGTAMPR